MILNKGKDLHTCWIQDRNWMLVEHVFIIVGLKRLIFESNPKTSFYIFHSQKFLFRNEFFAFIINFMAV